MTQQKVDGTQVDLTGSDGSGLTNTPQFDTVNAFTAEQTFTRLAGGERAIDVTLGASEVILSGDVKLRDDNDLGTSRLASWSDVASSDVGLTLETQDNGVSNTAITMTFECAILALTATDITFDGQSLLYIPLTINTQAGTSYTLLLTDAGDYVRMTSGSANTVTIPTNASVAFDIGTEVIVRQAGAGTTTIAGPGVTINTSNTLVLAAQHDSVSLVKVATDIWDLTGATA
jgi:hypothetical protein